MSDPSPVTRLQEALDIWNDCGHWTPQESGEDLAEAAREALVWMQRENERIREAKFQAWNRGCSAGHIDLTTSDNPYRKENA